MVNQMRPYFNRLFRITGIFVICSAIFSSPANSQDLDKNALREYIKSGMAQWEIPGLSVAIVQNDNVLFAEGFGVKKLGENDPVDANTLFGVASTTKAMTATALGILVDEGHIDWDDPVIKYLPNFQLIDPWVTRHVTIRDLLTHQVGLGRITGNRIEFMPNESRDEIIYRMRYHEFELPFRQGSVYSNVMYMIAGEVVQAVTGVSWDDFLTDRIFRSIGMNRSNTSITRFGDDENLAWPHQEIDGEVIPIQRRNFDNVGPSASVNSSALEFTRWMRLNLGEPGVLNDVRYVSRQVMHEIHRPQTASRIFNPYGPQSSYGLGWSISDYRGHRMLQHGGATDGMNTNLVLFPNENIGIVVLTNNFNQFMTALGNHIADKLLGLPPQNWAENIWSSWETQYANATQLRAEVDSARVQGTSPTLNLTEYTGQYYDNLYGEADVYMDGTDLRIRFWDDPTQELLLEHWHYDTFKATWANRAKREKLIHFNIGMNGDVEALNVTWTLRPIVLQVGIYPANYTRTTRFIKN
jgi:CubicO group peptidase (beta-lactamase class C family)